jgi:O-succinylbenzoic acid--CoA ligase
MIKFAKSNYNWQVLEQLKLVVSQWQIHNQTEDIIYLTNFYINQISHIGQPHPLIFLAEKSFDKFLSILFASVITQSCLFLINPHWQLTEYQQIKTIVKPDLFLGDNKYYHLFFVNRVSQNNDRYKRFSGIMIPTGGTSGKIKFAIHTWETLTASAQSFYQYFQQTPINCYCCLPLYHVSGLMQIVRSFISGSQLIINRYSNLKKNLHNLSAYHNYFISLVPTQLKFILEHNSEWLAQFKTVLVGGASINQQLKEQAKKSQINLALTYGMTETASGISILKPEDFLRGNQSNGKILPHAEITINSETRSLINKNCNKGIITIKASSLFKGYYPHFNHLDSFITDDIGYLDHHQYLYILGRNSQKIITGGENIFPQEVEAVIWETGLVQDLCIISTKDDYWGEIMIIFYVPVKQSISEIEIKTIIKEQLAHYKLPKIWYRVDSIPRNPQGKINYHSLQAMLDIDKC